MQGIGVGVTKESKMIAFIVIVEVSLVVVAFAAVYGLTRYQSRPSRRDDRRGPGTPPDPDEHAPRTRER